MRSILLRLDCQHHLGQLHQTFLLHPFHLFLCPPSRISAPLFPLPIFSSWLPSSDDCCSSWIRLRPLQELSLSLLSFPSPSPLWSPRRGAWLYLWILLPSKPSLVGELVPASSPGRWAPGAKPLATVCPHPTLSVGAPQHLWPSLPSKRFWPFAPLFLCRRPPLSDASSFRSGGSASRSCSPTASGLPAPPDPSSLTWFEGPWSSTASVENRQVPAPSSWWRSRLASSRRTCTFASSSASWRTATR